MFDKRIRSRRRRIFRAQAAAENNECRSTFPCKNENVTRRQRMNRTALKQHRDFVSVRAFRQPQVTNLVGTQLGSGADRRGNAFLATVGSLGVLAVRSTVSKTEPSMVPKRARVG